MGSDYKNSDNMAVFIIHSLYCFGSHAAGFKRNSIHNHNKIIDNWLKHMAKTTFKTVQFCIRCQEECSVVATYIIYQQIVDRVLNNVNCRDYYIFC
jgi:hypothetical protein